MAVVVYTTGAPGSGKSFCRCSVAVIEFLSTTDGGLWCNYPLHIDKVCAEVAKRRKCEPSDVADRINMIPHEELTRWMNGTSGPWDFFHGRDLSACHIGIDEIHNFANREGHKGLAYVLAPGVFERFPKGLKTKYLTMWEMWIGEVRHLGCTIEFLTQDESKVAKQIEAVCDFRYVLNHREEKRDFFTGAKFGDLWNLMAVFMHVYLPSTTLVELRKFCGRWQKVNMRIYVFDPFYYQFYDSHSASQLSGASGKITARPWQRMARFELVLWFVKRNIGGLWWRLIVAVLLLVLLLSGGRVLLPIQDLLFRQMGVPTSKDNKAVSKYFQDAMHPVSPSNPPQRKDLPDVQSLPPSSAGRVAGVSASVVCASCKQSASDLAASRAIVKKLESENKELAGALGSNYHFVGFFPPFVLARSGRRFRVGDFLPAVNEKITITSINFEERTITLSSGVVVYVP